MVFSVRDRPRFLTGLLASALLLLAGQMLLLALGPYSRIQGTFTSRRGIALLAPDSHYYLDSSRTFSALLDAPWTNWSYLFIGRLAHTTGRAADAIVVLQLLTVLLVGAVIFVAMRHLTGSLGAWVALAAFSANPFVAQWFRFVLTETLFYSIVILLVLLSSGLIGRLANNSLPATGLQLTLGIVAAGMRPNGVLVLVSVLLLVLWRSIPRLQAILASALLIAAVPLLLVAVLSSTGQPAEGSVTSQLYRGVVIEGTDEVRVRIAMPEPDSRDDESLSAAVRYALAEPVSVVRLVTSRVAVEVLQVRPHYPLLVNISAALAILLYLGAAVMGGLRQAGAPLRGPTIAIALPLLFIVGLTFASPESRYGWGGLVAFAPLVGVGADRVLAGRGPFGRSRGGDELQPR